jgi:hypothetical protein
MGCYVWFRLSSASGPTRKSGNVRFCAAVGEEEAGMGRSIAYRHDLLNKDVGICHNDNLVELMRTSMPAVLLEAGSIINRDEEVEMASPERQDLTAGSVATAFKIFCGVAEPETVASDKNLCATHKICGCPVLRGKRNKFARSEHYRF